ncbi:hypothetical protein [Methyloversatilis universalis]|nr:hypothetical protein [Methyloversatilis universalis]
MGGQIDPDLQTGGTTAKPRGDFTCADEAGEQAAIQAFSHSPIHFFQNPT